MLAKGIAFISPPLKKHSTHVSTVQNRQHLRDPLRRLEVEGHLNSVTSGDPD
jgi:hypothetical protein